jgi:hypothetical protein
MIRRVGVKELMRRFSKEESTVYKWGQPLSENGHRAPEEVTDFFLSNPDLPSALKWEYTMSFAQPAGFTVIQRSGLEALLDGRAYTGENHLADICACGTPLLWRVDNGKARSICVRCHR